MTGVHVACAADGDYVAHCAAMVHSAMTACSGEEVVFHFLHGPDLPASVGPAMTRMVEAGGCRLELHGLGARTTARLPVHDRWTPAIWYRIFLPDLLPEVARVLYLDADTLVLDALRPLFELDLAGRHVGAVTNVLPSHHADHAAEIGLADRAYFNSGVLLMDLEAMRRDGITGRLHEAAVRGGQDLLWPDQDVLNLVLAGTRLPLHPRWNRMNSFDFPRAADVHGEAALQEARAAPAIRHFEGPDVCKPWHLLAPDDDRRAYARHRRQTPWPRFRRTGVTPGNVRRRVARSLRLSA